MDPQKIAARVNYAGGIVMDIPESRKLGIHAIVRELFKQERQSYTAEHDRKYTGELLMSGVSYVASATATAYKLDGAYFNSKSIERAFWQFGNESYKPRGMRANLIRGIAMQVAELNRIEEMVDRYYCYADESGNNVIALRYDAVTGTAKEIEDTMMGVAGFCLGGRARLLPVCDFPVISMASPVGHHFIAEEHFDYDPLESIFAACFISVKPPLIIRVLQDGVPPEGLFSDPRSLIIMDSI